MTQILDNLYLGGKRDAIKEDYDLIFSVLSTEEINLSPFDHQRIVRIDDAMESDVRSIIPLVATEISNAMRKNKKVLVHCHAGVSRSATLVIGFLMLDHHMNYDQAFMHIRMKRNICPNRNFIRQLKAIDALMH